MNKRRKQPMSYLEQQAFKQVVEGLDQEINDPAVAEPSDGADPFARPDEALEDDTFLPLGHIAIVGDYPSESDHELPDASDDSNESCNNSGE
jgi:hypothetical protein